MIEIKISGRGGQGAVLASKIVAATLFADGMWVQSFPSFGAERRGAPVSAFLRADEEEITLRCGVRHPDWIVLFDASLVDNPLIMGNTTSKTSILLNNSGTPLLPRTMQFKRLFQVDATAIAEKLALKTTSFSIVNTAMVGALARVSGLTDIANLRRVVHEMSPIKKESNATATQEAYENVEEVYHE